METSDPTEALAHIVEPFTRDEGIRHLWLGDSRMGKTTANVILLKLIESKKWVKYIVSIDDKDPKKPQYKGTYRANVKHLKSDYPMRYEDQKHIVLRGMGYRRQIGDVVDYAEVCKMGWDWIGRSPVTVMLNVDELADATNGYQAWLDMSWAHLYRKGGQIGYSIIATTQMPQTLTRETFALSETIGMFRMDSREAAYLVKYNAIPKEVEEVVPNLKVGEWILRRKSQPWDGKIYKFKL